MESLFYHSRALAENERKQVKDSTGAQGREEKQAGSR